VSHTSVEPVTNWHTVFPSQLHYTYVEKDAHTAVLFRDNIG